MILKTDAIALRVDPFSRTSQVVSWLTRDRGRVVTLAKGAQRPRSDFRGHLDVFYTCEIVYYSPALSGLATLKECAADVSREALRLDIRASACASYMCDLVQRLTAPGAHQEGLYDFVSQTLDILCAGDTGMPLRIVHWAELRLMGLLGMAPRLDRCTVCGSPLGPGESLNVISVPKGGVVCTSCRPIADGPIIPLGFDAMSVLRAWQAAGTPSRGRRTICSSEQRIGIEKALGALLTYHLEHSSSRAILFDLLTR